MTGNRTSAVAALVCALGLAAQAAGRLPGDYYNEYHFNYITPHTPWAKPYAQGPVRVFVIAPTHAAREVTELWQRLDAVVGGETAVDSNALGSTSRYIAQIQDTSPDEKKRRVLRKLREKWDVFVLANFPFKSLPLEAQFELLKAVKFGAGLVLVYDRPAYKEMWRHPLTGAASPLDCARETPLAGLTYYRAEFLKRVKAARLRDALPRLIAGFRLGKGRVARIDYAARSNVRIAGGFCLTPPELFTWRTLTEYDYHQSLVAKAVLWAARREPRVRFRSLPVEGFRLRAAEPTALRVRAWNASERPLDAALEASARNEWGEPEWKRRLSRRWTPGENVVALELPSLPGGTHFLDLRVVSAQGVEGWASAALLAQPPVRIARVRLEKLTFDRSEPCVGAVELDRACPGRGWAARVTLLDNYGRRFARGAFPLPAGARSARFSLPLSHAVSLAGRARAELTRGSEAVDAVEAEFFVRRPEGDQFPALVWGNYPGIFGAFAAAQLRRFGFNTILHYYGDGLSGEQRRPIDLARQDFRAVPYVTRISWKNGRVADPENARRLVEFLRERVRLSMPFQPLVYSLGDENFIPDDGGTNPKARPAFAEFLRRRYASVDALNRSWGTRFARFEDAAVLPRGAALRGNPPRYHDTEAFREWLYARWHRFCRRVIRQADPRARVGAEGSVPGNLEWSIQGLEFWGPYRRPEQIALLRSLAPRSLVRGSWFGGYNHNRRDRTYLPRFLWSTLMDGNTLLEVYCSYTCEDFYNSDLSFAYWMDWFLPELKEATDGLGQLLARSDHAFDRVALYHSQASLHLNACWKPFGRYDRAQRGALQMLEDQGFVPDYVTSSQVEAGALRRKPLDLLVLPLAAALSDKEAAAIEAFVRGGGVALAGVMPGVSNERCAPRPAAALDALFGVRRRRARVAPARGDVVVRLPSGPARLGRLEFDQAARAQTAKPLFPASPARPLLLDHPVGGGRAVLLNVSFAQYRSDDPAWPALAAALLDKLSVRPRWRVVDTQGRALPGLRVSAFRRGADEFVGILAPKRRDAGATFQVVVHAPGKRHIFDLRAGRYLGFTDRVALTLRETSAAFLCASSWRARRVRFAEAKWDAAAGGLRVRWTLEGEGPSDRVRPVFRVNVFAPNGRERVEYARTLYPPRLGGDAFIPLALNDPAGSWRVRVRHVNTGLTADALVAAQPGR